MAEATEQQQAAAAQSPQPASSAGEATAPVADTTMASATSATAAEDDPFVATPPDGSSDAGEVLVQSHSTDAADPAADNVQPPQTPDKDAEQQQQQQQQRGDGENAATEWGGKDDFPPHPQPATASKEALDKGKQSIADDDADSWKASHDDDAVAHTEKQQQQDNAQSEPWQAEQPDEALSAYAAKKAKSSASESGGAKPTLPSGAFGHIYITDALKSSDGGTSTFIVYCISLPALGLTSKRRYSEFEALRAALTALHPTRIVPPLPPKHTLGDYAAKQAKAKEDATIIARRRRMLGSFLERCAKDPVLGKDEVLRRFCDGRESWHDISTTPPLSNLPKSNLRAPARAPADPHASQAYAALPIPSAATPLRVPNSRFADSEAFTNRWAQHVGGSLEKANRRVARRWLDSSADYAELGAVLNGFSLSESAELALAIERTGQAADQMSIGLGEMLQEWEAKFTEPLAEYAQYGAILQKLLKWRHLKHLQYELAEDAVEAKRLQLEELERVEAESARLAAALESGARLNYTSSGGAGGPTQSRQGVWDGVNSRAGMRSSVFGAAAEDDDPPLPPSNAATSNPPSSAGVLEDEWADATPSARVAPQTHQAPRSALQTHAGGAGGSVRTLPQKRSGGGLLGALSHTFHSVMDVDPEATRRSRISKLREEIAQLDEALQLTADDLRFATSAIQASLDGFQREKVADMRAMFTAYAKIHRDFCRANLAHWQEAKAEIDKIQAKSEMPESNLAHARADAGASSSADR